MTVLMNVRAEYEEAEFDDKVEDYEEPPPAGDPPTETRLATLRIPGRKPQIVSVSIWRQIR
jgi:hypothetical protein